LTEEVFHWAGYIPGEFAPSIDILDFRNGQMKNRFKKDSFLFPEMKLTPDNPWQSGPHILKGKSVQRNGGLTTFCFQIN